MAINVLWADDQHAQRWASTIKGLTMYGFEVQILETLYGKSLIKNCEGKDIVVIHSGSTNPFSVIKYYTSKIRKTYPNIKICLQTNCKTDEILKCADLVVKAPLRPAFLAKKLKSLIG